MNNIIKYIHFHNDSDLPLLIDSWVDGSSILSTIKIEPREKRIIHSSVGEWHIHSMFAPSSEDRKIWCENGLGEHIQIGKFRSDPCVSGNYSWLESVLFECIYSEITTLEIPETKKNVRGIMTFSQKKTGCIKFPCL
jgi:hypothetical protein